MLPSHSRALSADGSAAPTDADADGDIPWTRLSFRAMGCQMTLTVASAQATRAEAALTDGRQCVEDLEQQISRFRPESDLSRLNAQTGSWQTVGPVLGRVLGVALRAARQTGGLCSPTLLSALETAGYDRDFAALTDASLEQRSDDRQLTAKCDREGVGASRQVAARRLRPPGARFTGGAWRAIRTSDHGSRVRLPSGVRLDLAGVAKGWTADRVADLLVQVGPCLVDAGGDLAARGDPGKPGGWPVAVASPFVPDADLTVVLLRDAGIATSGVDFRRWSRRGQPQHHLIDPRSGKSARTDALTVTVIASTTLEADVHAKAALLLGVRNGLAYLRRRGLAGLIARRTGHLFTTPCWSDYVIRS